MIKRFLYLLLAMVPVAIWAGEAPKPPKVVATRAAVAPKIDGRLDDAAWQAATWYGGFTLLDQVTVQANPQTRFKVLFDDSRLYFGIECAEPAIKDLHATVREHDGPVHRDDCVEIMLDPTGERVEYYHFTINPLGTRYDAELRQGGHVRSKEWNCDWVAQAHIGEQSWQVEAAIPFVELGLTGKSTGAWALNVTRERQAGQTQLSSFAPTTGGFHQPALYASLELPGATLSRYFWKMERPFEASVAREEGRLLYRAKLHLMNETGRLLPIELVPTLVQAGKSLAGPPVQDMLDAGQGREYSFKAPLPGEGNQTLVLTVRDRRDPNRVYCVRSLPVTLDYVPAEIIVTRPAYRNSIYATEKIDAVEATLRLALSPEEMAGTRALVSLVPEGQAGGKPVATTRVDKLEAQTRLRLPIGALAEGSYLLQVAVQERSGKQICVATAPIRKLPPAPNGHEWRLDEQMVLRHNGEPYLPFGWFSIPPAEMAKSDCPYTAMQTYNTQYQSVEQARAFLDEVAAAKTYVTLYPYPSSKMMNAWGEPLSDDDAKALAARIDALKDHPGILAWYMADEPELRPALPERTRRLYQVVADADPYHPCIMLNDTIAGIHKYADGGDILMPDPYPCFLKGGYAAQPIEKVSAFMKAAREASGGRKAIWITPQGFNYGDYGRAGQRGPNLTELRNMTYQAVVYGATGFLWYTFSHAGNYPDIGLGMPFLAREVQRLKAFVLSPDVPDAVRANAPKPEHIHVSLRRAGGQSVLFVVNTATETQSVELTLPQEMARELHVVSEGRTVAARDGRLRETFTPYAVHIYATSAELAGQERLADLQRAIDAANAARKKPGNLAFEDSGVTVSYSSESKYGCTPERVVDGVTTNMLWQDGTPNQFPDWIALTWPAAQRIGRVVTYSPTLADFEVQVPDGEGWRTVATVRNATTDAIEATFAPVETKVIRLQITRLRQGETLSRVWEIEAYEK